VHVDATGRPARLPGWFLSTYGEAAGGRTLTTKLRLPPPPPGAGSRPWVLRSTDLDVLGHVNNAAVWAAVEDECAARAVVPAGVELEFLGPLRQDDDVVLLSTAGDRLDLWLTVAGDPRVAAAVRPTVTA
jgi:acyl-ACP thioesterase